jgi:hypothetical protein
MDKKISNYISKKNKENKKIIDYKKIYKLNFIKNNLLSVSYNDKILLIGEYNFYGIYQPLTKLWIWGNSIPGVNKKILKNIEIIKKKSYLFENDNNRKTNFYYQLLTQDVILILDEKMLDWIKDVIMFLSDDILIFNPSNSDSNIQFITLKNIKEKFI